MIGTVIKQMAYASGVILHKGTGRPLDGEIQITAEEGTVVGKVLADGTFVVSGYEKFTGLSLHISAQSPMYRAGHVELAHPAVLFPPGADYDPEPPALPTALFDVGLVLLPADEVNVRGLVVEASNPESPISGATVEIQHDGPTFQTFTDSAGRYRFEEEVNATVQIINGKVVTTPPKITCSATGFVSVTRNLLLDYSKLVNEENFRLASV
jgi:hypothetical protein